MKHFRIILKDVTDCYCDGRIHIRHTIEQRHTILFFFHFWSSPTFEPPHSFMSLDEAIFKIKEKYKNANIIIENLMQSSYGKKNCYSYTS